MYLDNYRIIFAAVGLIGILLFASPTIGLLIEPSVGEQFSELYILGPNRMLEDIPFNIKTGIEYSVYLGVGNHMGSPSYYTCNVKLQNETDPLPNPKLGTPSPFPTLYEYKPFIKNGQTWEAPLTFQVNEIAFADNTSKISSITINGMDLNVNKASVWNSNKTGYYYRLFVELWIFNSTSEVSQFHNRFVHLTLNMTGI